MSYFEQQKQIEAENEELARRKIEDELEIQNEEAKKALEAQTHLHTENTPCYDDLHRQSSCGTVSIEYEENENVNNLREKENFFFVFRNYIMFFNL
jgi:hypothetical protein